MFQKGLICTDYSDGMYRLDHFVPSLAAGGFREIVFFHNLNWPVEREIPREDPEMMQAERQRLQDLVREHPERVQVQVEVQMGRPDDNILRLSAAKQSDVIFLGTPTRTLLAEKLFGSTTAKVVERTDKPLVILRPQLISTYTTAELDLRCRHLFQYLLIPFDGSTGADHLIQEIKRNVQDNPESVLERCRLLWVIDDSIRPELRGAASVQAAEEKLVQVQSELAALNLVVNVAVVYGDPLRETLKAAEAHDIGAIAVCPRGLGGIMKWSAPSFTRELMRICWHPLLIFPPPRS